MSFSQNQEGITFTEGDQASMYQQQQLDQPVDSVFNQEINSFQQNQQINQTYGQEGQSFTTQEYAQNYQSLQQTVDSYPKSFESYQVPNLTNSFTDQSTSNQEQTYQYTYSDPQQYQSDSQPIDIQSKFQNFQLSDSQNPFQNLSSLYLDTHAKSQPPSLPSKPTTRFSSVPKSPLPAKSAKTHIPIPLSAIYQSQNNIDANIT